jgi:hypothetical protein
MNVLVLEGPTARVYIAFLRPLPRGDGCKRPLLHYGATFVAVYPDLGLWKVAPLAERVGLRPNRPTKI